MKEISLNKKYKVITLFFSGNTYDEIVAEVGISKGSVVNTVEDFKAGKLPIAPNEYIDALRELAVDLRKQHTSVKQLKRYVVIDEKLVGMGVGVEQVDDWLDIVEDIATEPASEENFVSAALEMSWMEMETGLDSASLVAEYKSKSEDLKMLQAEVVETTKLKEKATSELGAINQAMMAAQKQHNVQTTKLKAKLDQYLVEAELNWDLVTAVKAILYGELTKERLGKEEIRIISKQIAEIGSLASSIKAKKKENKALEEYIVVLKEDTHNMEMAYIGLHKHNDQLASHVYSVMEGKKVLEKQLEETKWQLGELKTLKYHYAEDIYTGWLILVFLHNPEAMSDDDFGWFAETINGVRMARLGEKPKQAVDAEGKVICHCQVPVSHTPFGDYGVAMDKARERLAECLVSLLKDKFVPLAEYKQTKMMQEINDIQQKLVSALSGHHEESYQPADQPESSGQETKPEEMDPNAKPHEVVAAGAVASEHPAFSQSGIDYWSPQAIKARWKADKEFGAKVGPRISSTNTKGKATK